ncbi:NAD(P)-dependent oxidoreductase [Ruegeria sp.]|uniref:NAD-dependent epimerase/dehydratase family protein n=1 Tax=Ruegeria sp. TaxID=1879320 RepID=UPI00232390FD|nr:NAD(P)-dependent oxidoreductase [Ruegeria sp.]MDA7964138.1 NAD(P)-dependent oxidoreductase [Ruegeria sp.]
MSLRVLVTGASGLIGPHACTALKARGFEVITLGRNARCDIVADLLDDQSRRNAVKQARATHLLHLAWHDDPRNRWSAPENLDWAAATIDLIRAFSAHGGERALCAGSCAEYDLSPAALGNGVLTEDSPLNPASLYGRAKAQTGQLLLGAQAELGLSISWGRIFFCYGPDEAPGRLLSDITRGILNAERVPCTDGLQQRDFLYTPDLGEALAAVLTSGLTGAVNIGSGIATPVRDLIIGAADLLGRSDLIDLGARPRPPQDPPVICADTGKLRSIGWAPRFSLQDGLRDCFECQNLLGGGR